MSPSFRLIFSGVFAATALLTSGCGTSVKDMARAVSKETGLSVALADKANESECLKNQLHSLYSEYKTLSLSDQIWLKQSLKNQFSGIVFNADRKIQTVWHEHPVLILNTIGEGHTFEQEPVYSYIKPHTPVGRARVGDPEMGKDVLILTAGYREERQQNRYFETRTEWVFKRAKSVGDDVFLEGLARGWIWRGIETKEKFVKNTCFNPFSLRAVLDLM